MLVTPEFVKKELTKLEKKVQANEMTRKEALDMLDKADSTKLSLQREEVALRTLAAGGVPKVARLALAQQLADVMKVSFDETSIMELINKYEKQDTVAEPSKPVVAKTSSPKASAPKDEVSTDEAPKKKGRPRLTEEQKAENARKRALAAAATATAATATIATPPPVEEAATEPVDEDEDEYFDPDAYEDE